MSHPNATRCPKMMPTVASHWKRNWMPLPVFDPLKSDSQLSQPDTLDNSMSGSTSGAEGPKTPPHYSDASATVPPFDLTQLGIPPTMSPVTEQENELMNLAPGSPVNMGPHQGLARVRIGRSAAHTPETPCQ